MREILFRGKTVRGEWVYGYLAKFRNFVNNVYTSIIQINDFETNECNMQDNACVIPESVGQYTGLKDKNGKKIFEGDIIRAITLDTGSEQMAVVCFGNFIDENNGDEYIGFYIEFDGIKTTATQLAMEECKNRIEVIGNIYDNPELLEVK